MFNWFKEALRNSMPPQRTETPKPVIKNRGQKLENLPPAEKFALRPGRTYRTFPDDLPESAIPQSCDSCGSPYDGPTQAQCRACGQGRVAYKVDVTDEPFHTLPPKIKGEAPEVNADELIPSFGGDDIILGAKTETPCAFGNSVRIGSESVVRQIVGNKVFLATAVDAEIVVAHDTIETESRFTCDDGDGDGGVTAKRIILGWGTDIVGDIVLPNDGFLSLQGNCTVSRLIAGEGATIVAGDKLEVGTLIILGPNVKIALGESCSITTIKSNHNFQLKTGTSFSNEDRIGLQDNYNLAVEISNLISRALNLAE